MSNVKIGGILYIKCKDCKLVKTPKANDKDYGFLMLQPQTPVQWLGPAPEDPTFHKIEYKGQIGYTLRQNLTTSPVPPSLGPCFKCDGAGHVAVNWGASQGFIKCEMCNGTGGWGKPMSAQAFASHGAGTKG
ncbi:MAG: hypothetical protein KA746_08005 [Pyrinomonadaceae bacterium]|nr:hypothetical protein [Pyrinomonadaceae bacterium]MBP6213260.1 hypothetical protein [Pyrinomonadaceae bacterium]